MPYVTLPEVQQRYLNLPKDEQRYLTLTEFQLPHITLPQVQQHLASEFHVDVAVRTLRTWCTSGLLGAFKMQELDSLVEGLLGHWWALAPGAIHWLGEEIKYWLAKEIRVKDVLPLICDDMGAVVCSRARLQAILGCKKTKACAEMKELGAVRWKSQLYIPYDMVMAKYSHRVAALERRIHGEYGWGGVESTMLRSREARMQHLPVPQVRSRGGR